MSAITKQRVDSEKGNRSTDNYCAGGYRTPQNIRACELPDRQKGGNHGNDYGNGCHPE
jgi:hypothetical protein